MIAVRKPTAPSTLLRVPANDSQNNVYVIRWNLTHYSRVAQQTDYLRWRSAPVCLPAFGDQPGYTTWHFEAFPRAADASLDVTVYLDRYLYLDGSLADKSVQKTVEFGVYLVDSKGTRINDKTFDTKYVFRPGQAWSVAFSHIPTNIVTNDVLGLEVKLGMTYPVPAAAAAASTATVQLFPPKTSEKVGQDLGSLLKDDMFTDIVLVSEDDRRFSCHRAILVARSPVFCAMFTSNMAEQHQKEVRIGRIEGDTLEKLIEYLYTGSWTRTPGQSSTAEIEHLLAAADMYGVKDLKTTCQVLLTQELSVDHICDTLILADLFNCETLREAAVFYMAENIDAVAKTDGWQRLSGPKEEKPNLVELALKSGQSGESATDNDDDDDNRADDAEPPNKKLRQATDQQSTNNADAS